MDPISNIYNINSEATNKPAEADKVKQLYVANNNNNIDNNDDVVFPLTLSLVHAELQLELQNADSKINKYLNDNNSGYRTKRFDNVELVFYDDRIYVPSSLR